MKHVIAKSVLVGLSVGIGSVIYKLAFRESQEFSWWHLAIVGFISSAISAAWVARKPVA